MAPHLVLLTGATGLIGFRVLQELLQKTDYTVRATVRSEEKAQMILSNPVIQKLNPGARLTYTIVPDILAEDAFDAALKNATYVIHTGSPVPVPGFDPLTQVWKPTVEGTANLLKSALKIPTIKRVLITSSIVANMAPMPDPSITVTATSRVTLPGIPDTFSNVFEAYVLGKITELNETDAFVEQEKPPFSVARVIPGYVYGRDELVLTADAAIAKGSSCGILLRSVTGIDCPAPIHGGYVHIDDLAQVYLKVLQLESAADAAPHSFGACSLVDYADAWRIVEKNFPAAVAAGQLKQANLPTLPIAYDSTETERYLDVQFRPFEDAVKDVVQFYLNQREAEKA
ncbi:putative cinnamoyl-CoA reductase [Aspergillus homomorphus CBS 101889]|uniref:Putative cinnamoyl-CoA reductase n=1 Tax=Aspergillus homomorphus (strain CBS 101889) TaxID=1450537 RepID=A0A395HZ09_ASPHC|nr:putative cinnamoyl-CoA reductase [Aspergillus homomorphus CBS 101889]RAL13172.1 putative cinnamoyl-CoA reductase [Aspergillus homomorphus CBS 101889]